MAEPTQAELERAEKEILALEGQDEHHLDGIKWYREKFIIERVLLTKAQKELDGWKAFAELNARAANDSNRRIAELRNEIGWWVKLAAAEIRKIRGFTQSGTDEQRKFYQMGISDAAEAVEQLTEKP